MGYDMMYQAMPDDASILQWARDDATVSEEYMPFFEQNAKGIFPPLADENYRAFVKEAQETAKQYPGLEERNLSAGRIWDTLHYLLSEKRRTTTFPDYTDFATRVIRGGDFLYSGPSSYVPINPMFRQPTRYMPPDEVHKVVDWLNAITEKKLFEHWDLETMYERGIYKVVVKGDWVIDGFKELKTFYVLAATYNEGVITSIIG